MGPAQPASYDADASLATEPVGHRQPYGIAPSRIRQVFHQPENVFVIEFIQRGFPRRRIGGIPFHDRKFPGMLPEVIRNAMEDHPADPALQRAGKEAEA